ncbi:glycosyltransferase [Flavobacterium sp. GP15]|uniref:glycosyltransferase n=1 Tax=Flavobacterium sp. GP15 TaxID=2758567 RepID=UPI00165E9284|nr:glycosyltransferase [Flavobacterium sp. GP15]
MIPKIIHYCWFGGKRKPKLVQDCIKSWRKYLPDYKFIEWNENNSDLSHLFVKEVYRLKKWAFVADYIRLNVLYVNGGIYLDTDMMVLKSFNNLLDNKCFFGAEDKFFISCGVIGSVKNNEFIKDCISQYDLISINNDIDFSHITIPRIITDIYRKKYNYFLSFDKKTEQDIIVIYPFTFFYPLPHSNKEDFKQYKDYLSSDSFAVHLWNESWIDYNEFQYLKKGKYFLGIKLILKNIFIKGKIEMSYFRKILSHFKAILIK